MKDHNKKASAEKRALWAVRKQYGISSNKSPRAGRGLRQHPNTSKIPPNTPTRNIAPVKRKHPWIKRIILTIIVLLIISGGVFGYKVIAASDKISTADRSIIGQLKDLFLSQGNMLNGEEEGRINILLMAVGGKGHKGQDLADTIMLASIRPEDNTASLLSIPRDLYVQVPHEDYYSKINAVHAYGESKKKDLGPELLQELVEEISGQPIHYFVRVDFTAFKNIIDAVGGVNITIENTFFDYWHKISFPAGVEKMNGERSLAYVRARYIEGPEGGDFRRAGRQQQVLLAIREKVFSVQTALDFSKMNAILNSLSNNIRTDMELWELKRFYELARTTNPDQVQSVVLTTGPKGVLVGETQVLGGVPASVLKPRTGNYTEIQTIASNIFDTADTNNNKPSAETPPQEETAPKPEEDPTPEEDKEIVKPTAEVRNTTNITGLAGKVRDNIRDDGYKVLSAGNATVRDQQSTVIYIINEEVSEGAKELADLLSATTKSGLPDQEEPTDADVLILVGEDADN